MEDAIVMEIEITASPERLFRALTDPEQLVAWWGADGRTVSWELELRVGGRWLSRGKDESCGDYELKGEILELDPPRVLAYTWEESLATPRGMGRTTVRYELEPTGNGTRVRVTHSGFANREALEDYRGDWPGVLNRLRVYTEAKAA